MKFTVETADLRQALVSVAPHLDPDKDFTQLHRVRLDVSGENIHVSATNRYTVGHAIVSAWQTDGEVGPVDLSPSDVKAILALFPGKKANSGDQPDDVVEIDVDEKHLTVTDVSGMFPGKSLQLPRYPVEENFTDIPTLMAAKLQARRKPADRLITNGKLLALFTHAAAAYAEPLVLDPSGEGGSIFITCGESFLGLLVPLRPDEQTVAKITGWHADWVNRLRTVRPDGDR